MDVKIDEPYLKATVISTERARAVKAIMVSSFWLAWKSWARLWAKSWIPPEMELAPVPELIELEGTHLFRSGELKHCDIICSSYFLHISKFFFVNFSTYINVIHV